MNSECIEIVVIIRKERKDQSLKLLHQESKFCDLKWELSDKIYSKYSIVVLWVNDPTEAFRIGYLFGKQNLLHTSSLTDLLTEKIEKN